MVAVVVAAPAGYTDRRSRYSRSRAGRRCTQTRRRRRRKGHRLDIGKSPSSRVVAAAAHIGCHNRCSQSRSDINWYTQIQGRHHRSHRQRHSDRFPCSTLAVAGVPQHHISEQHNQCSRIPRSNNCIRIPSRHHRIQYRVRVDTRIRTQATCWECGWRWRQRRTRTWRRRRWWW